jgi:alkylhydroperoxidase family enzyme
MAEAVPFPVRALLPEASHQLDTVNRAAARAVDPQLLDLIGMATAELIGNPAAVSRGAVDARSHGMPAEKLSARERYWTSSLFSEFEKACLTFSEQMVIDVSGITDPQRDLLRRALPDQGARAFVTAIYATELSQRLDLMSPPLLGDAASNQRPDELATSPDHPDEAPGPALIQALRTYQDAVMRESVLDPVVTELVRLRCARVHNCRICKTLRLDSARSAGVDESMTAKVDFYAQSDLEPHIKVALQITDAFITRPDTLTEAVAAQARSTYAPMQLASLLLLITKWSTQKIHVALGTDGADALPKDASGLSYFDFADDGKVAGYSSTPVGG